MKKAVAFWRPYTSHQCAQEEPSGATRNRGSPTLVVVGRSLRTVPAYRSEVGFASGTPQAPYVCGRTGLLVAKKLSGQRCDLVLGTHKQ